MNKITLEKGQRFGRLTVVEEVKAVSASRRYLCRCDCGISKIVGLSDIRHGKVSSCGCFRREVAVERFTTHGRTRDPVYRVWASMVERCNEPRCRAYPSYGGRGIQVCDRWLKFENFIRDMGERPEGSVRYTVERVNNDLGYSKDNCKWATYEEQANNKSANVRIEFNGRSLTFSQWCRELNISRSAMNHRFKAGWSVDEAFSTPYPSPYRIKRKEKLHEAAKD